MDYKKIYNDLIISRLKLKDERLKLKKDGSYFEAHHIKPKCKGGDNSPNNIVLLTAREHFLAHWLLWLIFRDRQMALAFHKMLSCNKNQNRITSSKGYEEAREAYRLTNIGNTYGKAGKGKIISEEQKSNHSKIMKGKFIGDKNPFFNKKHDKTTIDRFSEIAKERLNDKNGRYKGKKYLIKDGVIVGEFESVIEISKIIGCTVSNVRNTLGGNQKTAKGFRIIHEKDLMLDDRTSLTNRYYGWLTK